jgi:hypothetical protein
MIMTSTPDPGPGLAGTAPDVPEAADSGTGDQIDMRSPRWQRPAAATWLVVTEIGGPAGEVFTARTVPGPQPRAFGGDVLLHVAPGTGPEADTVISMAAWDLPDDSGWPERVRATVMFAISAMTDLGEHVDLGECDAVDLDAAAGAAVPGLPRSLAPGSRVAAMG